MYHTLHGLVLRTETLAEADKRVTLYTRQWGKISAVMPGAKKIRAKLSSAAEPVMESEFMVYAKSSSSRAKVTGAKIINNFHELKKRWRSFCIAQQCCEIAEALTPYNSENEQKYDLILRTWELLGHAQHPRRIMLAFILRFLRLSGYSFVEYLKKEVSFIAVQDKEIIRQIAILPGEEIDRGLIISDETEKNIERCLDNYLQMYIPRPLASKKFWRSIETIEVKL